MGIGDWGLGPIPNPQSPIPILVSNLIYYLNIILFTIKNLKYSLKNKYIT